MEDTALDSHADDDDDLLVEQPNHRSNALLQSTVDETTELPAVYVQKRYKTVRTVWAIVVSIFLQICLVLTTFLVPYFCPESQLPAALQHGLVLVYVHVFVYICIAGLHLYFRWQHIVSRRYGYGTFFRGTVLLRRLPFYTMTAGNTALLLMLLLMFEFDYCNAQRNSASCLSVLRARLDRINWIQILVCIEAAVCLPTLIIYSIKTVQFNRQRLMPDIFRESALSSDTNSHRVVLGYRDHSLVEELLEKQMDKINYLTARCKHLTRCLSEAMSTRPELLDGSVGHGTPRENSITDLSSSFQHSNSLLVNVTE